VGPVQLDEVVTEAVKLLRATTPALVEFEVRLAPALPPVLGNASQLHQVLMNLGTNAVQAMEGGAGRLLIRLDALTTEEAAAAAPAGLPAGPGVRLTVTDTGRGMDPATQERVFEPFFTTKAPGEGTGLGLSVVHGIVRGHRGAIRLASELGRGSTFEIFLPATAAPPQPEDEPPAVEVLPLGHGERVLFVDDEQQIASVGKMILDQLGYVTESESEVLRALARVEADPAAYQLVVSDQTMPEMTGLEFARRIHALRPDLPVVLTSGHSVDLTPERVNEVGVREVLAKPYTTEQLARAIARNLPGGGQG
jgi:CheY-like chemotaxis protein